jgi:FkbM family methyltransferase
MTIKILTNKFHNKINIIYRSIFIYSTNKFLGIATTDRLDDLYFKLFPKLGIKNIIEIGANEASASIEAIKIGCSALAVEANPFTFSKITPKSTDKLTKVNIGLSDKDGSLNFYMPKADNTAGSSTFLPREGLDYDCIEVPTMQLDKLMTEYNINDDPFALWIDVEGMQKQVLHGSCKTLKNKNCKLLKIEVEDLELFKGQEWLTADIENFLNEFDFIPAYRDFEYLNQFNVIYVKKDSLPLVDKDAEASIQSSLRKKITIFRIIKLLSKKEHLLSEAKCLFIKFFGRKYAKYLAIFGSKSSQRSL